jgi:hypothetical protein
MSRSISRSDRTVGDWFTECERVVQHWGQYPAENSEANCSGVGLLPPKFRMGACVEIMNSSTPGDEEDANYCQCHTCENQLESVVIPARIR